MEKMSKKLIIKLFLILLVAFSFLFISIVDAKARRGCCSHHGGVCGCSCCDGTSLSSKCAPYYPQCSSKASMYDYEKKESEWYNNGLIYLMGCIAIWIGGGWIWEKIEERKK